MLHGVAKNLPTKLEKQTPEASIYRLACCSVAKSRPTLWDLVDCTPGFPVLHYLPEFAQTHVYWVDDAIQLSHPLLPLFSLCLIFPSIRVFSSESFLPIRWPKYWSFSFSISLSNEYSGFISFMIDPFWSPCCPRDSQEPSPTPQFKSINSLSLSFLYSPTHIHIGLLEKI